MGSQKADLLVANRYAKALFLYAREKQELDSVKVELDNINEWIKGSAELNAFISNPLVSRKNKVGIVKKLLEKNKTSKTVVKFCQLLAHRKRLNILPLIVKTFNNKVAEHNGEVEAELISANELDKNQIKKINAMLTEKLKKEIKLVTKIDASICGGIIIKIGSQMLDGSIKSQLERISMTSKKVITSL